jgi:pimeloyl-ACP methyl ester carboxylesterase
MISAGRRNHHALAHATRELVRIVIDAFVRRRDAHGQQQLQRPLARSLRRHLVMVADRLDQLVAHREQRMQAGQRILEDRADFLAAQTLARLGRQVVDAPARQVDFAAAQPPGRLQQADHRHAGQRLAGAGFADHAQDLARLDVETDVACGDQDAVARRELDRQAAHRQGRRGVGRGRRLRGVGNEGHHDGLLAGRG